MIDEVQLAYSYLLSIALSFSKSNLYKVSHKDGGLPSSFLREPLPIHSSNVSCLSWFPLSLLPVTSVSTAGRRVGGIALPVVVVGAAIGVGIVVAAIAIGVVVSIVVGCIARGAIVTGIIVVAL